MKMGPILRRKSGKGKLEGASVSAIESVKTELKKPKLQTQIFGDELNPKVALLSLSVPWDSKDKTRLVQK